MKTPAGLRRGGEPTRAAPGMRAGYLLQPYLRSTFRHSSVTRGLSACSVHTDTKFRHMNVLASIGRCRGCAAPPSTQYVRQQYSPEQRIVQAIPHAKDQEHWVQPAVGDPVYSCVQLDVVKDEYVIDKRGGQSCERARSFSARTARCG